MTTPPAPPTIFSPTRRLARRQRSAALRGQAQRFAHGAPAYLLDDMVEDVIERLAFVRHQPTRALVVGDWTGTLAQHLAAQGAQVMVADPAGLGGALRLDEEAPYPQGEFDLIASLGCLDSVNDLPGALLHMRHALAKGGMAIASLMGAGCLPTLRAIMLAADADRPAARMHPMVDVRAGAQLLQRAGWADPVADSRSLSVRFGTLQGLVGDCRAQGLGSVLAEAGPALGKAAWARAQAAFAGEADPQGRVTECFEIITLSGWRR